MKFLFDTNIYFAILYDPDYLPNHASLLAAVAPRTYLSSVVRHELIRGAQGDVERARVRRATAQLERVGRAVAPTHAEWVRAGTVQGRIWDARPDLRSKDLQNDILIASTARVIGAEVITENLSDFRVIGKFLSHRACSMRELAARLRV